MTTTSPSPRPGLRVILREIVTDRTLALMLALSFSTGLPILLVYRTQSLRLSQAGISKTEIALFSWVALCYSLKFLWSPIIDTVDLPVLSPLLGRRRAWMLLAQMSVVLGLVCLAFGDPKGSLTYLVVFSFLTAFAAATQDIVIDGWRIDAAPVERQGIMTATYQFGYQLALLAAGAGALYLASWGGWTLSYILMALLMGVGITACLIAPRLPDRNVAGGDRSLRTSFIAPLRDLFARFHYLLVPILLLVAIYRLPDFLTGIISGPLYIDLKFSLDEIATATKIYGLWVGLAGAFAGGVAVSRLGLMPTLLIGGISAAASHLTLAWLAASGHDFGLLVVSVCIEHFAGGMAGVALIAYMSSLTSPAMAASQYALLSSLYALPGKVFGGLSGWIVDHSSYSAFFIGSSTIGIPVALLTLLIWWRQRGLVVRPAPDPEPSVEPAR